MIVNKDIIYLVFFLIIFCKLFIKRKENMTNVNSVTEQTITTLIKKIYKTDVEAIRNLADIADKLQGKGKYKNKEIVLPGNLTIQGNLKINKDLSVDKNSVIRGNSSTGNITSTGSINGRSITSTGNINGGSITSRGNINGGSITSRGNINGGSITATSDIYLKNSSCKLTQSTGGTLQINTPHGWTRIGAKNSSWSYMETDRPKFYFNKQVQASGGFKHYNDKLNGYVRMIKLPAPFNKMVPVYKKY